MPPLSQRAETAVWRRTSGREHGHTACAGAARGVAWTSQGLGGVWGCGCLWQSTVALLPPPDAPSRQAWPVQAMRLWRRRCGLSLCEAAAVSRCLSTVVCALARQAQPAVKVRCAPSGAFSQSEQDRKPSNKGRSGGPGARPMRALSRGCRRTPWFCGLLWPLGLCGSARAWRRTVQHRLRAPGGPTRRKGRGSVPSGPARSRTARSFCRIRTAIWHPSLRWARSVMPSISRVERR